MVKNYGSRITVIKRYPEANAESSLNLVSLSATKDDRFTTRAGGDDEEAAVDAPAVLVTGG